MCIKSGGVGYMRENTVSVPWVEATHLEIKKKESFVHAIGMHLSIKLQKKKLYALYLWTYLVFVAYFWLKHTLYKSRMKESSEHFLFFYCIVGVAFFFFFCFDCTFICSYTFCSVAFAWRGCQLLVIPVRCINNPLASLSLAYLRSMWVLFAKTCDWCIHYFFVWGNLFLNKYCPGGTSGSRWTETAIATRIVPSTMFLCTSLHARIVVAS